jgi:hypothetical protein
MRTHHEGLAVHVGVRRDALQRTTRLAAAAGITRQRQLLGAQASRAEVDYALRGAAAGLDPQGHLLLAFAGPSHQDSVGRDGPPGVSWRLADGLLPLAEVAALLAAVPRTALITVIADTSYAGALADFTIPTPVVLLAACGADQEIPADPGDGFAARLERLVLRHGQHNPACASYLWLNRQFRRDAPDGARPHVWTNRPSLWAQRPFQPNRNAAAHRRRPHEPRHALPATTARLTLVSGLGASARHSAQPGRTRPDS